MRVRYCVSAKRHSRVWKNGVLCKRMKILEVRSESLCVCWTNVRRNTQGTHTDHGTDIATKTRNSCGRRRGVFKKREKRGQGATATGLQAPRDGQVGLTNVEEDGGLGCRLRRTKTILEKKQDLRWNGEDNRLRGKTRSRAKSGEDVTSWRRSSLDYVW